MAEPPEGGPLDALLGAVYRERVILGVDRGAAAALAAALMAPALAEAARARLAALRAIPEQRCFVAAQHRRYLEAALAS